MNVVRKSSFLELTKYLTNTQGKNERVGRISVTNCHHEDAYGAAIEVLATQKQNTRATSDKTYHLLVSFRSGESPAPEVLSAIEARICLGLGYGEHQRVSVVHHDTDNVHIHIAINKIHPARHTIHDPYNDHKTLGQLCEKLEQEYGLEKDNHCVKRRNSENKAIDMERHSGVESLIVWVKRECLTDIKQAESWSDLHQVMGVNGLKLVLRGNGLVVQSLDGTVAKASSIDRSLSKVKLEERFGLFQMPQSENFRDERGTVEIKKVYEKRSLYSGKEAVELYAKYRVEQQDIGVSRSNEWAVLRDRKNSMIEVAKRAGRLKRLAIQLMGVDGLGRKILYTLASKTLKEEIQKINRLYLKERQEIYEKYRRSSWADWLRSEATAGSQEALSALRSRDAKSRLSGNTMSANGPTKDMQKILPSHDSVTKSGTVIYCVGTSVIRDDGNKLKVSKDATSDGLEAALCIAMKRYGCHMVINGDANFKERVVRAAVSKRLPITFSDEALETQRLFLLDKPLHAREEKNSESRAGGRYVRGSTVDTGSNSRKTASTTSKQLFTDSAREFKFQHNKPNVSRVGCKPPPESQNRLRRLSQLGMVSIASGSEMLLPSHVPDYMEQQRTSSDNSLRRGVSGSGLINLDAADKYICEREEKRAKIFDIPKYRRCHAEDAGQVIYTGIRNIENQFLALLKSNEEVLVLPIDDMTAKRLRRISLGTVVNVTESGSIKKRGRGRSS